MIRHPFAPVLVFAATLLQAAPAVPLVNLVDDQTLLAVSVTDAPALLRGWDNGPVATTWSDPQVVKFLAPLREELHVESWDEETKTATGMTVRELLALAEGEALFAVPAFDVAKLDGKTPPPFLVALEIGSHGPKIEKILSESAGKQSRKEESETFSGVKVTTLPIRAPDDEAATDGDAASAPEYSVSWAIVDGIWLISLDKERVFSAIDAVKQGGLAAALGKNERFLRTRERVAAAQSLVYVNFPAIYPLIRDGIAASKAKSGGATPMGVDPEAVFNAFGLDAFGEGFLALSVSDTETRADAGLVYTEERGLLKLAAYQPGPAAQPDWIPAKWPSVSSMRFSIPKAYAGLEELLDAVSPMMSGMAQGYLRGLNKKLGIDLKRDLIGSLGDDVLSAYALPPGLEPGAVPAWTEMDQMFSVSLVNEEAFNRSIEALKKLAGPAAEKLFIQRDYLGQTLYTLDLPAAAAPGEKPRRGFTYAIANRTLLVGVGSPATVENALQGMASAQGLFWKRDDVKAALADLPADAVAVQVQDLRVMVASLVEMAVQLQATTNEGSDGDEKKTLLDASARPDSEVIARHWGLATGYVTRTAEGLFSTTHLAHPQK